MVYNLCVPVKKLGDEYTWKKDKLLYIIWA